MAKILAIMNQKGGVGKTTTAMNLGVGLRMRGARVLFIDLDPQCNLTYSMGGSSEGLTTKDLLEDPEIDLMSAVQRLPEGDLIPSSYELGTMDMINNYGGKAFQLSQALASAGTYYDYVMIDSPPAWSVLTVNILIAASEVVIPVQEDIFSLQGVGELYYSIQTVKDYCNPDLKILGILRVKSATRLILNRSISEMLHDTAEEIGTRVFRSRIREGVAVREAQANQKSIFLYAPKSKQAQDYNEFIEEFREIERSVEGEVS